jgi:hypothetical protein
MGRAGVLSTARPWLVPQARGHRGFRVESALFFTLRFALPASTQDPESDRSGLGKGLRFWIHLQGWIYRNRWLIVALVASFAVRVHWNLLVHPLGDYISSDMRGYVSRADQLIDKFGASMEYHAFFPYGTHFLLALLKLIFGRENYQAIGVVYALLGTMIVYYGVRIAERVSSRAWVPPLLGILMIFYYPLISLGGYTLSEVPFAVFLLASTHALLRLVQEGKSRDAWLAGTHAAIATAFRPQILMSIAVFGLVWLLFRKHTQARLKHLVFAAIPIAAVLVSRRRASITTPGASGWSARTATSTSCSGAATTRRPPQPRWSRAAGASASGLRRSSSSRSGPRRRRTRGCSSTRRSAPSCLTRATSPTPRRSTS